MDRFNDRTAVVDMVCWGKTNATLNWLQERLTTIVLEGSLGFDRGYSFLSLAIKAFCFFNEYFFAICLFSLSPLSVGRTCHFFNFQEIVLRLEILSGPTCKCL